MYKINELNKDQELLLKNILLQRLELEIEIAKEELDKNIEKAKVGNNIFNNIVTDVTNSVRSTNRTKYSNNLEDITKIKDTYCINLKVYSLETIKAELINLKKDINLYNLFILTLITDSSVKNFYGKKSLELLSNTIFDDSKLLQSYKDSFSKVYRELYNQNLLENQFVDLVTSTVLTCVNKTEKINEIKNLEYEDLSHYLSIKYCLFKFKYKTEDSLSKDELSDIITFINDLRQDCLYYILVEKENIEKHKKTRDLYNRFEKLLITEFN